MDSQPNAGLSSAIWPTMWDAPSQLELLVGVERGGAERVLEAADARVLCELVAELHVALQLDHREVEVELESGGRHGLIVAMDVGVICLPPCTHTSIYFLGGYL